MSLMMESLQYECRCAVESVEILLPAKGAAHRMNCRSGSISDFMTSVVQNRGCHNNESVS
jgi:hypothetical protein